MGAHLRLRRILWTIAAICALVAAVGCDQITKDLARQELADVSPQILLGGLVRLTYAENPGTFLGLGAGWNEGLRFVIYSASAIVVLVCLVLLFAFADRLGRLAGFGALVLLAGATGNLVDRFINDGRVIDFIVVGVGWMHTGVFNVADVFIALGLIVFLFAFPGKNRSGPRPPSAPDR